MENKVGKEETWGRERRQITLQFLQAEWRNVAFKRGSSAGWPGNLEVWMDIAKLPPQKVIPVYNLSNSLWMHLSHYTLANNKYHGLWYLLIW